MATPNIPSDSSKSSQIGQTNQNFQTVTKRLDTNIIKDLTGTPRVLMGTQKGSGNEPDFYGIKVSQENNDVTTAADDKLIMSSAFNMFKILQTGQVTLNGGATDGTSYTKTVTHNLGYRPMVIAQCELPAALGGNVVTVPYYWTQWSSPDLITRVAIEMYVNTNDIQFRIVHDSIIGAEDFDFTYYILAETGIS